MFGELPKVFDTKFLIGFFLPSAAFIAVSLFMATDCDLISSPTDLADDNVFVGTTIIALIIWLLAVILLAANRSIYMLLEGYGNYNPLKLWWNREKMRFDAVSGRYDQLSKEIEEMYSQGIAVPETMLGEKDDLRLKLVEEFPDQREWVLPTRLGNCIRAFEIYSGAMYGIEDISGWNRLVAVIPKEYLELVNQEKAQTDFWINLSFLSCFAALECLSIAAYCEDLGMLWWLMPVLLYAGYLFLRAARLAAIEWGDMVKASYDIFLPDLLKKLQFHTPSTAEEERSTWRNFSEAILYRKPAKMPRRDATGQNAAPPKDAKS